MKETFLCFVCSHTWMYTSEFITCSTAYNCLKPLIVTLCDGAPAQIPVRQVKSKCGTSKIYVCGICVYLELLVDVRQVRVVPVPVAFQVEPVLSFIMRVGSLLKPPADLKQQDWMNMTKSRQVKQQETHPTTHTAFDYPCSNQMVSNASDTAAVVHFVLRGVL